MATLMTQGVDLAIIGMGTVFVFLSLLVIATQLMSMAILRFSPDEADPAEAAAAPGLTPKKVAAIMAAVAMYRQQHEPSRSPD